MARSNTQLYFQKSALAAALLAAFTCFYPVSSPAYETFPIIADDGTHYFNVNVQTPGEYHPIAQDEYGLPLTDRFITSTELNAVKMGAEYFWELLKDDYKSTEPINILLMPYSTQDGNAAADSPFHANYPMTQLGAAWIGLDVPDANEAVYIIMDRPIFGDWYTETFPVLPDQGIQPNLPTIIMHELFHGFGLGVIFSQDEFGNIGLSGDNTSLYVLHLYDQKGHSFEDLLGQPDNRFVKINYVTPVDGSFTPTCDDQFNIYAVWRDSGVYFSGNHVNEVLAGALLAWPEDIFSYGVNDQTRKPVPGIPINGFDYDEDGNLVLDLSHIELQNSLMSHQFYRNWGVLMEAEIALLQDIGYKIDRKRFYGRSIYNSGTQEKPNVIENDQGYWARNDEGTDWLEGQASTQSWGIGLHIYGSYNKVTQKASLLADGDWGIGARIEGVGNELTVASGTVIEANGRGGRGLLFSWGKEHNAVIEKGAIVRAVGDQGIAVSFDFGSNLLGDYQGYFGSYTGMVYNQNLQTLPTVVDGPLVENFTVAGTLEGSLASIYISPNAYVRNVNVLPGAQIKGDIISLWNPYETIYGTPRFIDPQKADFYTTTLTFGSQDGISTTSDNGNKINFEGNIVGRDSIHLVIGDASLAMNGRADVLDVHVTESGVLEGGLYTLYGSDPLFTNDGHLISTALNPIVINGNYVQTDTAKLTLSVSGGRYIPLSVSGSTKLPDTLTVIGTPEGGWHPTGIIKVDTNTPIVAGVENTASKVEFSWKDPKDMVSSPVVDIQETDSGDLYVTRKDQPYSQFMPTELKDIGLIWDQSVENLTESASQKLFAALDWSSPEVIANAADALSGAGIQDGLTASMKLDRIAQNFLKPDLSLYTSPGLYVWVSPVGGSAKTEFNGSMRMRLAGVEAGTVNADADFINGYSVMALDADGDGSNISNYEAKGIWLSAFIRNRNFMQSGLFADASARLGYIDSEEKRSLSFAGLKDETKADIDHWSFGLSATVGKQFKATDSLSLEPFVGLSGFLQYVPSYEEESSGAGALQTNSALYRSLEANLGMKLSGEAHGHVTAHWQLYAQYARELLNKAGQTRLSFAASDLKGHFDRNLEWESKNRIETGLNLGLTNKDGFSLSTEINYERESSGSDCLLGAFKAEWRF